MRNLLFFIFFFPVLSFSQTQPNSDGFSCSCSGGTGRSTSESSAANDAALSGLGFGSTASLGTALCTSSSGFEANLACFESQICPLGDGSFGYANPNVDTCADVCTDSNGDYVAALADGTCPSDDSSCTAGETFFSANESSFCSSGCTANPVESITFSNIDNEFVLTGEECGSSTSSSGGLTSSSSSSSSTSSSSGDGGDSSTSSSSGDGGDSSTSSSSGDGGDSSTSSSSGGVSSSSSGGSGDDGTSEEGEEGEEVEVSASSADDCSDSPSCDGDTVQCAILEQDFNLRCARVSGLFDCSTSFVCEGDTVSCLNLEYQRERDCSLLNALPSSAASDSLLVDKVGIDDGSDFDGGSDVDGSVIDVSTLTNGLVENLFNFGSSCPADIPFVVLNVSYVVQLSRICDFLKLTGLLLLVASYWSAALIIFSAF